MFLVSSDSSFLNRYTLIETAMACKTLLDSKIVWCIFENLNVYSRILWFLFSKILMYIRKSWYIFNNFDIYSKSIMYIWNYWYIFNNFDKYSKIIMYFRKSCLYSKNLDFCACHIKIAYFSFCFYSRGSIFFFYIRTLLHPMGSLLYIPVLLPLLNTSVHWTL